MSITGKVCILVLETKEVGLHLSSFNPKCLFSGDWTLLNSVLEHQQPLK